MKMFHALMAAIAVYVIGTAATHAADKAGGGPAAIVVASPFAGAYIGAHVGYAQLNDDSSFNGWLGGAHAGYNAPIGGGLILGAELDGSLSAANLSTSDDDVSLKVSNDWLASIRAKLGVEMGHVMPYATAGIAWGKFSAKASDNKTTESESTTERLWVIGAGLDYAMPATNVIVNIGVLHYFDDAIADGLTTVRGGVSVRLN